MNMVLPAATTSTQSVQVLNDVTTAHPTFVCAWTATLTPAKAWISLSSDLLTITVEPTSMVVPTDYGTWPFVLTVNSLLYSTTVTQIT